MDWSRIKLTAKLDRPNGNEVVCGREGCKGALYARIVRAGPGYLVLASGWTILSTETRWRRHTLPGAPPIADDREPVWRVTKHAAQRLAGGFGPHARRRPAPEIRLTRFPNRLICPWCGTAQWVRRAPLGLPPEHNEGREKSS